MNLGNRFKRFRQKAGLTQKQAAEIIGINSYQLGNYETNRSEPSIAVLKGMSKAYHVKIDTLVGNFVENDKSMWDSPNKEEFDRLMNELIKLYKTNK